MADDGPPTNRFGLLLLAVSSLVSPVAVTSAQTVRPSLAATADTFVIRASPNVSRSHRPTLWVRERDSARTLIQFDSAAITEALGDERLGRAILRLYITSSNNQWPENGQNFHLHPMNEGWTGPGATWNCPDDTELGNNGPDCDPNWEMADRKRAPFEPNPTQTRRIRNGQLGWVTWDVSSDISSFLAGETSYHGWILLAEDERPGPVPFPRQRQKVGGRLAFSSREGNFPPELVLISETALGIDRVPPTIISIVSPPPPMRPVGIERIP